MIAAAGFPLTVDTLGNIVLAGSLADGTSLSQTSAVSMEGVWPLYVPLYGGTGSLWSWNYFSNRAILSATNASWINTSNSSKTAPYRAGFTNEGVSVVGSWYDPKKNPLLALTNGQVTLDGGSVPAITNQITLASNDTITLTSSAENTNQLTLKINKSTGGIAGTFVNPSNTKQTLKISGVLLQNETSATGYFLGTNLSGTFRLSPP